MNQITREKALENLITFKTAWGEKLNTETDQLGNFEDRYDRQFFINLLACFGNDISTANVFQTRATRRSTGRLGKIDLYCPGLVIGEAKSPGKETLDEAFEQLSDYLWDEKLDQEYVPNYSITTNFETFRVDKLGPRGISESKIEFSLTDINSHVDELMFLAGFETTLEEEVQKEASFEAVDLMTDIYKALQGNDSVELNDTDIEETHTVAVAQFMTRILFLLFGDDANLWKKNLFTEFIEKSSPNSIVADLNTLFYVLNTPIDKRPSNLPEHIDSFPYVNGGVFDTEQTQQMPPLVFFDEPMYEALHEASLFDWSNISPAVFGSLFQLVKSKEARRKDGEHYTSEEDILKVLEPMFLDEFLEKSGRLVNNSSTKKSDIAKYMHELSQHVFVDPACGSGNFLIVAYRELRRIENRLIKKQREIDGNENQIASVDLYRAIRLNQFYGFELGWWPAKIAETALFLIEQQCNKELADLVGEMPDILPIADSATIVHGNALQMDWEKVLSDRVAGGGEHLYLEIHLSRGRVRKLMINKKS